MYGFGGDSWRAPLRKRRNAQAVPYEHPAGMRIWKCRITAASVPGIEIASATPAAVFQRKAVMLDLLNPVRAGGRLGDWDGKARLDETVRRYAVQLGG
jgi:hypothetical protein